MKILVICQYYYPEPFRISDICEELTQKGHEVMVITGLPNYPMVEIYNGYQKKIGVTEVINGVKVHRCYEIPRKNNILFRMLNYYSFMFSSTQYIKKMNEEYDRVFVYQLSPVMMAKAALKYKKKFNKKVVLYCLDLWPASLSMGGISKKSLLYKYFRKVSKDIYTKVDEILVTSKSFADYFVEVLDVKDVKYLPQYAEEIFSPEECRKKDDGIIDLMFAGNVGVAQSVETIIYAANELKNNNSVRWHIVGDGSELEKMIHLATELKLKNIIFHGRKNIDEMPKMYSMADVMLVTMKVDEFLSSTLPAKVQSYMAAGKPIIGAIDGETALVIQSAKCGLCGNAGDVQELVSNVQKFIDLDKVNFSQNARKYYDEHFEKKLFMDKLEKELICIS